MSCHPTLSKNAYSYLDADHSSKKPHSIHPGRSHSSMYVFQAAPKERGVRSTTTHDEKATRLKPTSISHGDSRQVIPLNIPLSAAIAMTIYVITFHNYTLCEIAEPARTQSEKSFGAIVEDFHPIIKPDRCCFSYFDLLGVSPSQTCHDIQQALFQRYKLRDLDQTYNVKMLTIHKNESTKFMGLSLKACPVKVAKRLTKQGKLCAIVFERVPSIVLREVLERRERMRHSMQSPTSSRLPLLTTKHLPLITPSHPPTATKTLPFAPPSLATQQLPSATPSYSTLVEDGSHKSFKVSPDDHVSKILPEALRKYKIDSNMGSYALYITYQDKERCLGAYEKPLAVFRQLETEGVDPMFMLENHATPMMGYVEDLMGEKTDFLEECLSLFGRGV